LTAEAISGRGENRTRVLDVVAFNPYGFYLAPGFPASI